VLFGSKVRYVSSFSAAKLPRRSVRYRRNLAVAVPFGEGPFTTRFADLRHRAAKVGGLLR